MGVRANPNPSSHPKIRSIILLLLVEAYLTTCPGLARFGPRAGPSLCLLFCASDSSIRLSIRSPSCATTPKPNSRCLPNRAPVHSLDVLSASSMSEAR